MVEGRQRGGAAVVGLARRHPAVVYSLAAYVLTWAVWLPRALVHQGRLAWEWPVVLGQVWSYGPALAAVATAASVAGRPGLRQLGRALVRWRLGWRWYLVVFVAPFAIAGIGRLLHAQLTGQPAHWPVQEPAELLVLPLLILILALVPTAVLFTWVFNHPQGSVLLAILLHATQNLAGPELPRPDEGLFTPFLLVTGLKWMLALVVLAVDPRFRIRGAPAGAGAATAPA